MAPLALFRGGYRHPTWEGGHTDTDIFGPNGPFGTFSGWVPAPNMGGGAHGYGHIWPGGAHGYGGYGLNPKP